MASPQLAGAWFKSRTQAAILFVLAVLIVASPARAYLVTVNQAGGGDANTFQGGLDRLYALTTPAGTDTLVIMPGNYDESIDIEPWNFPQIYRRSDYFVAVIAPGGFERTRVRELHVGHTEPPTASVNGLSIVRPVHDEDCEIPWINCRFESGYEAICGSRNDESYVGCEFHGRVFLSGFGSSNEGVHDCRFVGAELQLNFQDDGNFVMKRCAFVGPADTALIADPSEGFVFFISDCTFSNFRYGIIHTTGNRGGFNVERCRFNDIAEDAVRFSDEGFFEGYADYEMQSLTLHESRFHRCGSALRWLSTARPSVELASDTISITRSTGVIANCGRCDASELLVERCGGDGVVFDAREENFSQPSDYFFRPTEISVGSSLFRDNAGSGLTVRDTAVSTSGLGATQVLLCTASDNGGKGFSCEGEGLWVANNLAHANHGSGFAIGLLGVRGELRLSTNSSVLNGGTGLVLTSDTAPASETITNNLAAFNGGSDFDFPVALAAASTHNDTWSNTKGSSLPNGSTNLALDPGLCDPLGGDDHLQSNSPCAPAGIYGQIGALGVGCDASKIMVELSDDSRRQEDRAGSIAGYGTLGGDNQSGSDHGDEHGRDHDSQLIRAAVLGTRVLDVSTLDPLTARLGTAPSLPSPSHNHAPSIMDLNHDGYPDLLLEFDPGAVGAPPSDGRLALTISTTSGLAERGEDHAPSCVSAGSGAGHRPHRVTDEATSVPFAIRNARFDESARQARVEFTVPCAGSVSIELFDVSGRRVSRTEIIATSAGTQSVELASERQLSSGIYLVRIARGGEVLSTRMVVIR